ncbi:leucine-rich repeat domain-containing protein [Stieleria varia]|uniref:Uncharacterized protein n=1 Tax=Stieleria varia TaxID=2528005 RepID=A0A5C6B8B6_9BACT|nr:hypothetical protein [Stieleria varia]TWU08323.1 hypothetical protein Pla52n_09050 [Stieleria varia]
MFKRMWMIALVWLYRPLNWLLGLFAILCLILTAFMLAEGQSSIRLRPAYPSATQQWPAGTLRNSDRFMQVVRDGVAEPSVRGLDFDAMNWREPGSPLADLSPWVDSLALFPKARWAKFSGNQLMEIGPDRLARLAALEAIVIEASTITQDDIDSIAGAKNLRWLELITLDMPASLQSLQQLPHLETLVLSHGDFTMTDEPISSLFARDRLSEISQLSGVRSLVLDPQYLPGRAFFAGSKTPDPACDPVIKENAGELLSGMPPLNQLWVGTSRTRNGPAELAQLQAKLPGVNVRSSKYNENSVMRLSFTALYFLIYMALVLYNMHGHFALPQTRVIPRHGSSHLRFVLGVVTLCVVIMTLGFWSAGNVHVLPSLGMILAIAALALLFWACISLWMIDHPGLGWLPTILMMPIFLLMGGQTFLTNHLPSLAPAIDHFLMGHQLWLAGVMIPTFIAMIVWLASRFAGEDRLVAENALAPMLTISDFQTQQETLTFRRRGKYFDRQFAAWQQQLATARNATTSWLHRVRMQWLGDSIMTLRQWLTTLVVVSFVIFGLDRFVWNSDEAGRHGQMTFLFFMILTVSIMIPCVSGMGRREMLGRELLHPTSRLQLVRDRMLSMTVRYAVMFATLLLWVIVARSIRGPELSVESVARMVVALSGLTIAATGLSLWVSISRSVVLAAILICVGAPVVMLTALICIEQTGDAPRDVARFLTTAIHNVWPYLVLYTLAILLTWTGYRRWMSCEVARQ